ncbi:MAG: inositol monophosphatase [Chloroflexales bacterium]|nr:inositol monophosphatase [Chloroflexales bacterium]
MSEVDIAEVRAWARECGALARRYFNAGTGRRKADRSWVTQADVEIEQFLRARIARNYPLHGVMGEEQGVDHAEREFVWSLDPLDGTGSFVSGLPIWGVSIGVLRAGQPFCGVIYLPLLDECYWADVSGPAFCNTVPIQVSDAATIDSTDWVGGPSKAHLRYRLSFPCKLRSLGSIAAYFCYTARGSAIGALLGRPHLWDMAAGMAILRAAGGVTALLDGSPLDTQALLRGDVPPLPVVIATPLLMGALREQIQLIPR